ncbi:MAG: DsrE family protein [Bacteroidales bacterium]|nr:DsrE family protein [Bacteroidales bacterium]
MKILIIINDAPYGTEKAYNALRMGITLLNDQENIDLRIFLLADAVNCALPNQKTPTGFYNIENMLKIIINDGGHIKACGGCSVARGIDKLKLIDGVELSNMQEFAEWVVESEKVLSF